MTKIEWTDETWGPIVGCRPVSSGCTHCYAAHFAHRGLSPRHRGLTKIVEHGPVWNGVVRWYPELLDVPSRWRKPRRVFVCPMSDLLHEDVPYSFLLRVFEAMEQAERHTFQILTKRASRFPQLVQDIVGDLGAWPPNVWAGVTVESRGACWRIDRLREVPARVRFLSCEPLLDDLRRLDLTGIHWVIVGGESGPGARPMRPEWVRSIRDQCIGACVPFFFKQWGGVNKKKNGRELDGRTWDLTP